MNIHHVIESFLLRPWLAQSQGSQLRTLKHPGGLMSSRSWNILNGFNVSLSAQDAQSNFFSGPKDSSASCGQPIRPRFWYSIEPPLGRLINDTLGFQEHNSQTIDGKLHAPQDKPSLKPLTCPTRTNRMNSIHQRRARPTRRLNTRHVGELR